MDKICIQIQLASKNRYELDVDIVKNYGYAYG